MVRVETSGQAAVQIVTAQDPEEPAANQRRRTLSEEEFLRELPDEATRRLYDRLFALADALGLVRTWRSSSVSLRLPDPNGSKYELTLIVLTVRGELYTGWLQHQLARIGHSRTIGAHYLLKLCSMFENLKPHHAHESGLSRMLNAAEVETHFDELADAMKETIEAIQTASGANANAG